MANKPVTVKSVKNSDAFLKRIKTIGNRVVYVGIPAESITRRRSDIKERAAKFTSFKKTSKAEKKRLRKIARNTHLTNAQLLYLFTKGSIAKNQPGRPVIEPAIMAPGNKQEIAELIALANKAYLDGQVYISKQLLKRAGVAGAKSARDWFTDPRNHWAPNAASTIAHKGFDSPGLDTRAMRNAITHVEKDV